VAWEACRDDSSSFAGAPVFGLAASWDLESASIAAAGLRADGLATSGLTPPKSNWARPIDAAPYRAWPVISANVFTFGGLKADRHARVIDHDGNPIPGLYAAGETMGIYYRTYTGSTSVLRGAVFGRQAALHATGQAA
jgi:tricarballylate dehydrogenase